MRAAGITEFGASVTSQDLAEPRALAAGEALITVEAAGVGNWDDVVRSGDWDVGGTPPMALGVEVAGTIAAVGHEPGEWRVGDEVLSHPLPLREQGAWAEYMIVPVALLARKPQHVGWAEAAAFPAPALTALQALDEGLRVGAGQSLLVHGGGTVTGAIAIGLAHAQDVRVIATAGPSSSARVRDLGADDVLDHHRPDWPDHVRELTGGTGVDAALNAARGDEPLAVRTVKDGGRLATITGAPPPIERGLTVTDVYVRPDGAQLRRLATLLGHGTVAVAVGATFGLEDAAAALAAAVAGGNGGAVVLTVAAAATGTSA